MSETLITRIFENWWYFVLLIALWYVLYVLWKLFITEHLKYEEQRTNSFVELTNRTIENTTRIVDSLNTHKQHNEETHNIIIKKINDTHNDVKIIKDKIK